MILSGKIAVVTGGGQGNGKATALKLASAGATVVVVARAKSKLQDVVAEVEARGGDYLVPGQTRRRCHHE